MLFLTLTLENFGLYHGQHSLNLQPETTPAGHRPIILIGGQNGGGKTTLIDAIRLALYGSRAPIDRRRKNQPYAEFLRDCISRQAEPASLAIVELSFQQVLRLGNIDRQAEIRVQRRWSHSQSETLQVYLDGWPDDNLTQTWDERIEDWLPLGLSNLFLFDGEQIKALAEQDSPPPSVITAIRTVLGLSLIDRLSRDLDNLTEQKHRDQAKTAASQQLTAIEQDLSQHRQDLEREQTEITILQAQIPAAEAALTAASQQLEAEGGSIRESFPQLERQIQIYRSEAEHQRQNLRHLAADLLPLGQITPLLQAAQQQAQLETQRQQAQSAQTLLQTQTQQLLDLINQLQLSRSQTRQITALLQSQTQQLDQLSRSPSWLNADPDACAAQAALPQQLSQLRQQSHSQITSLHRLEVHLEALSQKLAAAASPEDYARLSSQRQQAQRHLEQLLEQIDQRQRQAAKLMQDIATCKAKLQEYGNLHGNQQDTRDLLQAAARVQQTLASFRDRLTLRKVQDLETRIAQYFRLLLHKSSLVQHIQMDSQSFSLTLYGSSGILPKHSLSAGEKQLLAIAFLWALSSLSGRQLPVAIDTPLSRLDSSHRQNLIQQYFPSASHQMILLSTDTEIGAAEVKALRTQSAIAREYRLSHDARSQQSQVESGYFW